MDSNNFEWACIGYDPIIWGLGIIKESIMHIIIAKIERQNDGSWIWKIKSDHALWGKEPSRKMAIETVNKQLKHSLLSPHSIYSNT